MIGLFALLGYYELHGYEDLGLSFCVDVRSPFSDIYLGMELLGQNGSSMFNYLRNYQTFQSSVAILFTFLMQRYIITIC